jgi:biuret amidohydrolase
MDRAVSATASTPAARGLLLSPESCVALTVDMQREYLDRTVGAKTMPEDRAAALVQNAARFLNGCRALEVPVVHCYVTRSPAEVARGKDPFRFHAVHSGGDQVPDRLDGTAAAAVPDVLLAASDIHVRSKRTMDSFFGTELDYLLGRILCRPFVLLTGINTETCIYCAAVGASVRGYRPVVVRDCVGTRRASALSEKALDLMASTIAWVIPADDVIAGLRSGIPATPVQ